MAQIDYYAPQVNALLEKAGTAVQPETTGNLTDLATQNKNNLVEAINEVLAAAGGEYAERAEAAAEAAEEVLESIPEDYSDLSAKVSDLNSALENEIVADNYTGYFGQAYTYLISGTNKWAEVSGTHVMVPVNPGDTVYIEAGSKGVYYGVLTKFDLPTTGNTPCSFSAAEDFAARKNVAANSSDTITIPADGAYIGFNKTYGGNNYLPTVLTINGVDMTKGLSQKISDIKNLLAPAFSTTANYIPGMIVQYNGEVYRFQAVHSGVWDDNDVEKISLGELLQYTLSPLKPNAVNNLPDNADFNDYKSCMFAELYRIYNYINCPVSNARAYLIVLNPGKIEASGGVIRVMQILVSYTDNAIFTRLYSKESSEEVASWKSWVKICGDATVPLKMQAGANTNRKVIDHGGFFDRVGVDNTPQYQNSPRAFLRAQKEGVMYHSVDVCFSSDGVPFVLHNNTFTDTEGNSYTCYTKTASELKQIEVGDSNYSWTLQTLAECNEYIKSIGGVIESVDVSAPRGTYDTFSTNNAAALPGYYRANNINPIWTNWDAALHRNAFITNGPEFGILIVCNSTSDIEAAITYIQNHSTTKFQVGLWLSTGGMTQTEAKAYLSTLRGLGVSVGGFTYNKTSSTVSNLPMWLDRITTEDCNWNYEQMAAGGVF